MERLTLNHAVERVSVVPATTCPKSELLFFNDKACGLRDGNRLVASKLSDLLVTSLTGGEERPATRHSSLTAALPAAHSISAYPYASGTGDRRSQPIPRARGSSSEGGRRRLPTIRLFSDFVTSFD